MSKIVELRESIKADLEIFYQQQLDPDAVAMAAFPSRNREQFFKHWLTKVLVNPDAVNRTVLYDGKVAGHIACYRLGDEYDIGYWYGREFWGKGIATEALAQLLNLVTRRPLKAFVSKTNPGSRRVLEKNGFVVVGEESSFSEQMNQQITEYILQLE